MKKWIVLLAVVVLFSMSGCSSETPEQEAPPQESVEAQPEQEEAVTESPAEVEPEPEEEETLESLLSVIQPIVFESLVVETDLSGPEGFMSKSTLYQKGENTRTEMEIPDGPKQIMIFQAAEKVIYTYAEGEMQGMKIVIPEDEEGLDPGGILGMTEPPDFSDVEEHMNENMVIRKEELNGKKVVYVEFNDLANGAGQTVVKMWFSEEYAYPVLNEVFSNGELMMRSEVKRLEVNANLDDALFMPPEDVIFIDLFGEGGLPTAPGGE